MQQTKEFKLTRIELHNVFNYRGTHSIDFTGGRKGNIFLFDIKNGGGKTSLFLGIKWGFYGLDSGVEYEKDGIKLYNKDFMNQDECESEGRFYVKICFEYDGQYMELRRECPDYRKNDTVLSLKVNGFVERGDKCREIVSKIIPPDYGDFFMFNGEVLARIASNQGDVEKTDNVMKLMGLSQLRDLMDILHLIQRAMTSEFSSSKDANSELSGVCNEVQRLTDKLDRVKVEEAELVKSREEVLGQIHELEQERLRYSDKEGTSNDIDKARMRKHGFEEERDARVGYIRTHSVDSFMLFLEDEIEGLIDYYDIRRRDLDVELRKERRNGNEYLDLQRSMLENHLNECPVCKSLLTDEVMNTIRNMVEESHASTDHFKELKLEQRSIEDDLGLIKDVYRKLPGNLVINCNEFFDLMEKIDGEESRIMNLNTLASKADLDSIKEISNKLEPLYRKSINLKNDLFQKSNQVINTKKALDIQRGKMTRMSATGSKFSKDSARLDFINKLVKNLENIIRTISRNKRIEILNTANDVFLDITNKRGVYRGLEYESRDSFSMHIVRNDGVVIPLPSSGENHVLAISFLISLSLNSERLTPLMMDTPLSRLDVEHKTNIGKVLNKLGNQVLFLAQPGELDDETRKSIQPAVSKMYVAKPTEDNTACITEVEL